MCKGCLIGYYQEEDSFIGGSCMKCPLINGFNQTTDSMNSTSDDDCKRKSNLLI